MLDKDSSGKLLLVYNDREKNSHDISKRHPQRGLTPREHVSTLVRMSAACHEERSNRGPHKGNLGAEAREVLVAMNPTAGTGRKREAVHRFAQALEQHDLKVRIVEGRDRLKSELRSAEAIKNLRCVVAAGGDGTAAEVANRAGDIPMALFPLGTENLLARHLGVTQTSAAEVIVQGMVRRIDLPRANGRFFTLMAGVGFDADVVHRVAGRRRGNLVRFDYGKPIVESLRTYTYPEVLAWIDENPTPLRGRMALIFNLPCYALGLPLAPQARGDDGLLDLVLFEGGSVTKILRYLWAVVRGRHTRLPDVHVVQARHIRFEAEPRVPVQLDGDPFEWTPLEVTVEKRSLRVVVPAAGNSDQEA